MLIFDSVTGDLKKELFGQNEKTKKFSEEIQLKSLTLAYEIFFLYDIENMITETFVTELNQKFLTYGLISFSGETKTNNKLDLITLNNKFKFNMREDAYQNKITLSWVKYILKHHLV